MKTGRVFAAFTSVTLALAMGGFVSAASAAAAPANDHLADATDVSALPFTQMLDTTGATTDADDAQVNATCGAPVTNNSVWYTFTAGASDTLLVVDTAGSDYSSGVIIATGTPGALTTQACAPVKSQLATEAGTTYYVLAFDDTGSGGMLHVAMHGPGPVPPNDRIGGATVVGAIPFHDTLDVTGATTGPSDKQANETCGAPATGNSVWYKFTAGADDTDIFLDANLSDYFAGILVATGTPGALTTVACGPFSVIASTTPGTTYYIMVFDFLGGGGGTLQLDIGPAPGIDLRVRSRTLLDGSGAAHLTGTYSCTGANDFEMFGQLLEIVRRNLASGEFFNLFDPPRCNGHRHPWEGTVSPFTGEFAPGKAAAFISAFACNDVVCAIADLAQVVVLTDTLTGASSSAPVTSLHTRMSLRSRPSTRRTYGVAHATTPAWGR